MSRWVRVRKNFRSSMSCNTDPYLEIKLDDHSVVIVRPALGSECPEERCSIGTITRAFRDLADQLNLVADEFERDHNEMFEDVP